MSIGEDAVDFGLRIAAHERDGLGVLTFDLGERLGVGLGLLSGPSQ